MSFKEYDRHKFKESENLLVTGFIQVQEKRERKRKRVGTVVHNWGRESNSLPMGREYILNVNIRELTLNNHVIFLIYHNQYLAINNFILNFLTGAT